MTTTHLAPPSRSALTLNQLRLEQKSYWRNKQAAMFTFAMPLFFVLIFPSLITYDVAPGLNFKQYFVSGMIAVALLSSSYSSTAIGLSFQRDDLVLKRLRGTPLGIGSLFGAKILNLVFVGIAQVFLVLMVGRLVYGIGFPKNWIPFIIFCLIGITAFSMIGIAYTGLVPNADSAPAIVQLPFIVLQFISGVFFSFNESPKWLQWIADIFPLRWMVDGMRAAYLGLDFVNGKTETVKGQAEYVPAQVSGLEALTSQWKGLLIIGLWFLGAALFARKYFRWERRHV